MSEEKSSYDPSILYHSHSFNIPHLNSWIDELVRLTERGQAVSDTPTTDNLVQALQRYDAAFRELLRQTSLFSEPVTKLLAKVWGGVLKLLEYMIKSYHRYVKHTSGLQKQAQLLVTEKLNQSVASKVREDEFELERTFLKARIRNLESEIESLKATERGMDRENNHLRSILDAYVKSKELNEPLWDILQDEKSADKKSTAGEHGRKLVHGDDADDPTAHALALAQFKRSNTIDLGREQLRILNRLDIEMNELFTNVLKEEDRQRVLVTDLIGVLEANQEVFGVGCRVGNKWRNGQHALVQKMDQAIQVDLKDEFGVVTDLIETPREGVHIPPPFSANSKSVRGSSVPYLFRSSMSTFPHVLRIPPAAWVYQVILSIYMDKINMDDQQPQSLNRPKQGLTEHIFNYFLRTLGLASVADAQVAQLLQACEVYMTKFRRIALFASQIGLHDKEASPNLDIRDTDFVLGVIKNLVSLGELVPEKASKRKLSKNAIVIKPDISRGSAVSTTQTIFEKWLPDGGHDYVLKVKAMAPTERGNKFIDLDEFIELLIEPWHTVRLTWEDHLRYMYHEHCIVYRVLSEAQFANDAGARDKDTIVSQLSKSSAVECARRPLRLFQRRESDRGAEEGPVGRRPPGKASTAAKEPIVELMNRKAFINTLSILSPSLRYDDVRALPSFQLALLTYSYSTLHPLKCQNQMNFIYNEAVESGYKNCLRVLELMWLRCVHKYNHAELHNLRKLEAGDVPESREYYVNMRTSLCQWMRPYHQRVFHAQDIEVDTFVNMCIQYDVLARSPLVEFLHIAPKDLWPNADMFLKQLKNKKSVAPGSQP